MYHFMYHFRLRHVAYHFIYHFRFRHQYTIFFTISCYTINIPFYLPFQITPRVPAFLPPTIKHWTPSTGTAKAAAAATITIAESSNENKPITNEVTRPRGSQGRVRPPHRHPRSPENDLRRPRLQLPAVSFRSRSLRRRAPTISTTSESSTDSNRAPPTGPTSRKRQQVPIWNI